MTTATITSYDILDVYDYFDKGDDLVMVNGDGLVIMMMMMMMMID